MRLRDLPWMRGVVEVQHGLANTTDGDACGVRARCARLARGAEARGSLRSRSQVRGPGSSGLRSNTADA